MNKKGFVFIETVVVLVVVVLSLTILLMSYSLIESRTDDKRYYDLPRDIYLLYSVGNFIDTNDLSMESALNIPSTQNIDKDKFCYNSFMGEMVTNCVNMYEKLNIVSISVIDSVDDLLKNENRDFLFSNYDNGAIEYIKTLQKSKSGVPIRYIFGEFKRDGHYYYASIPI